VIGREFDRLVRIALAPRIARAILHLAPGSGHFTEVMNRNRVAALADYAKLLIMQICRPESAPSLIDSGVRGFLALHNQMVFRKLISESGAR